MASATFKRQWVIENAENTLVYIKTLRQSEWKQAYDRAVAPYSIGFGLYRIPSALSAMDRADKEVPKYRYAMWEEDVEQIRDLAIMSKGEVTLSHEDAEKLVLK